MKKFLMLMMCCIWSVSGFAGDTASLVKKVESLRESIESLIVQSKSERSLLSTAILETNLVLIQKKIKKKIHSAEKRLMKYQASLESAENEEGVQLFFKKVQDQQAKLQTLNDLLDTLEMWKNKFAH